MDNHTPRLPKKNLLNNRYAHAQDDRGRFSASALFGDSVVQLNCKPLGHNVLSLRQTNMEPDWVLKGSMFVDGTQWLCLSHTPKVGAGTRRVSKTGGNQNTASLIRAEDCFSPIWMGWGGVEAIGHSALWTLAIFSASHSPKKRKKNPPTWVGLSPRFGAACFKVSVKPKLVSCGLGGGLFKEGLSSLDLSGDVLRPLRLVHEEKASRSDFQAQAGVGVEKWQKAWLGAPFFRGPPTIFWFSFGFPLTNPKQGTIKHRHPASLRNKWLNHDTKVAT